MKYFGILVVVTFLFGCNTGQDYYKAKEAVSKRAKEADVITIPLEGEVASRKLEASGLSWFNGNLMILPQFPEKFSNGKDGAFFIIKKEKIEEYLTGRNQAPLSAERIEVIYEGEKDFLSCDGGGFEGVVVDGNELYFVVESMDEGKTFCYLVKGSFDKATSTITITTKSKVKIDSQSGIHNLSDETILQKDDLLITLHEGNGVNITKVPVAHIIGCDMHEKRSLPMENVEYRITDATSVDSSGKFWVINYFYKGDFTDLKPVIDANFKGEGIGKTHYENKHVERLLEFVIMHDGIRRTQQNSIQFVLDKNGGRNWEGIVRYEDKGFLVVSDYYPKTILAFIPFRD